MNKFKLGDRVILTSYNQRHLPLGTKGVVVHFKSGNFIGVNFEGYTHGHDCDRTLSVGTKSGWYIEEHKLQLLTVRDWKGVINGKL
jgi:hypothetical protein